MRFFGTHTWHTTNHCAPSLLFTLGAFIPASFCLWETLCWASLYGPQFLWTGYYHPVLICQTPTFPMSFAASGIHRVLFFPNETYGWSPLGEALEKILFSDKRIDIRGKAYSNHALSTFCSICCLSRKAWISGLVTKQLKQACHCLLPSYSEGKKTEFLIV